ncbi:MAG: hypothetical protein WAM14_20925 [Candidatus Nitrosopolaris sp.]
MYDTKAIDDAPSNLVDITPPKVGILFNQPRNKDLNWPQSKYGGWTCTNTEAQGDF